MTLTIYGIKEWGLALIATLSIEAGATYLIYNNKYATCAWIVGGIVLVIFLAFAAFFRNPRRQIPSNPLLLVSPADGTIKDIEVVEDFDMAPFTGKALRVGIFLSVFNVHVNRAPAAMTVETVHYREGEYLDARDSQATKRNEAMTIAGTATMGDTKFPLAVRQISGAIARRIVCPVKAGQTIKRGAIYGMIKFGSRTEIYLPVDKFELNVKIGDKVNGGSSVIATMVD